MDSNSLYASYKRDTKDVLYWMVNLTNELVRKSQNHIRSHPVQENKTGKVTVENLMPMSRFIVQKNEQVPHYIFRYLRSIIHARTLVGNTFQQAAGSSQNSAVTHSNSTHSHFVATLKRVYSTLGGHEWEKTLATLAAPSDEAEDLEKMALVNRFQGLTVDKAGTSSSEAADRPAAPSRPRQKKGKGKKQKKKGRKNNSSRRQNHEVSRDEIQMMGENQSFLTDYSMAVLSAVKEWAELRTYLQNVWEKVAYKGGNSAVAVGTANVAVSIVKKTGQGIFIDFPDGDTYCDIITAITRGNIDQAQGRFALEFDHGSADTSSPTFIDIREHFLINIYENLKDFIADFRLNRTGKPSNNMRSRLNAWRSDIDLQSLTEQERLDWRRLYVIKWLYDLINAHYHKSTYGLNDFAKEVTRIAMSNADVTTLINGHHVFQLQCIVDAFIISRGWTPHAVSGHVTRPAANVVASRDLDTFFDGNAKKRLPGYTNCSNRLKTILGNPRRYPATQNITNALPSTRQDFLNCLGEHDDMAFMGTKTLLRPRDENVKSLHENSPFLCGAALLECMGLSYKIGMFLWETTPDPALMLFLSSGAGLLGMLPEESELWDRLGTWLSVEFDTASDVVQTPGMILQVAIEGQIHNNKERLRRPPLKIHQGNVTVDILRLVDLNSNHSFTKGSMVTCLQEAGWSIGDIPDEEIPFGGTEFWYRLDHTPREIDPETNELRLADSVLKRRAQDAGMTEEKYLLDRIELIKSGATKIRRGLEADSAINPAAQRGSQQLEVSTGAAAGGPSSEGDIITYRIPQSQALPSVLDDIEAAHTYLEWDICGRSLHGVESNEGEGETGGQEEGQDDDGDNDGDNDARNDEEEGVEEGEDPDRFTSHQPLPLSGLNYMDITCRMHEVLKAVEHRLREDEHPSYQRLYTEDNQRICRPRLIMESINFYRRENMSVEEDYQLMAMAQVLVRDRNHLRRVDDCLFWGVHEEQSTGAEDIGGAAAECNIL
ncbi:hypothetical protein ACHAPU_004656 [Fusarium lateritium]